MVQAVLVPVAISTWRVCHKHVEQRHEADSLRGSLLALLFLVLA